jgi:hypothetical protein
MPIGWRKRIRLGPFSINLSKRGLSAGGKIGPASINSRTRRLRLTGPFGTCGSRSGRAKNGSDRTVSISRDRGIIETAEVHPSELAPSETG